MLQEFHHWSPERQERWQKTQEKSYLNYLLKVTAMAFVAAVPFSLLDSAVTLASHLNFDLATVIAIPILGALSALITGRTKWVLS